MNLGFPVWGVGGGGGGGVGGGALDRSCKGVHVS